MKNQKYILLILLPIIAVMCVWIWSRTGTQYTLIMSDSGTWDLRGADFDADNFNLQGEVEYIPNALLTPEEFESRRDETQIGNPEQAASYSTSRIRILVPKGVYGLMGYSSEYASRVYINGVLAEEIGVPGNTAESSIPSSALLFYAVEARDGFIEIVQQASNYVYSFRDGSHANIIIGAPGNARGVYMKQIILASVVMGCFLTLAFAHFALYFQMRSYKANLWFALFCVAWFIRSGYTGPKILPLLLPLSWYMAFRLEYLTVPAGTLLFCMTLNAIIPGVIQKGFRIALAVACGLCAGMCLFANTVFMSETMPYFYAVVFLAAGYVIVRLVMKLRKPNIEQIIVLAGAGVFLYCALRDILYFSGINIFPFADRSVSEVALLIFVFFQMIAMFHGTMQEVIAAKQAEQRLAAENALLAKEAQIRKDMIHDLSHEVRTPLAVISSYAQSTVRQYRERRFDEQFVAGLDIINEEAQRIAVLASTTLSPRGTDLRPVDIGEISQQIVRLLTPRLRELGRTIAVNVSERLLTVCNASEITQVIWNLLDNALKHGGGGIDVSGNTNEEYAYIIVTDYGEGISPEILPRILERGVSGSGGSGLGLAISDEIVKRHGGQIIIESELGLGTAVTLLLPLYRINGEMADG